MSYFSTAEVQKRTGISARQLRWWDEIGLVKPSASPDRVRWHSRRYDLQDIVCILVVKALRGKGISIQKIRQSVERIKDIGIHHPLAQLRVACLPHSVIFKKGGKFIDPISGQMVFAEALEEIRPEFKNKGYAAVEREVKKSVGHFLQRVAKF